MDLVVLGGTSLSTKNISPGLTTADEQTPPTPRFVLVRDLRSFLLVGSSRHIFNFF